MKAAIIVLCLGLLAQGRSIDNSWQEELGEKLYRGFADALTSSQQEGSADASSRIVYDYPLVHTQTASFLGQTNENAHSFFAIPYAEPPVGDLRFMDPKPYAYNGQFFNVFEEDYVQCPQLESPKGKYSEDCLVMNIHVPKTVDPQQMGSGQVDQLLPVMVFIHGGAFFMGSGTGKPYDGRFLSESTNSIVVSFNYRLGALGFLAYEDENVSYGGNQAIKDQQMAMKFVHDNIKFFGGNPDKVTLFGESAGAQSVMFHLVSPVSEPYFQQAMMQSNPAIYKYQSLGDAKSRGADFARALNCSAQYDSYSECLKNMPYIDIVRSTSEFSIGLAKQGLVLDAIEPFRPVLDGHEFARQPFELFEDGTWQREKKVVVGSNQDEFVLLTKMVFIGTLDEELYKKATQLLVGAEMAPLVTAEYSKLLPQVVRPGYDYTPILSQQVRDLYFTCSIRRLARFISDTTPHADSPHLYLYEHNACPDSSSSKRVCAHTCHGCELPFEFNTMEFAGRVTDGSDDVISSIFSDYWKSFVEKGVPQSDRYSQWPAYKQDKNWENIRILAPQTQVDDHYNEDFCDFWDATGVYVDMHSDSRMRN